MEQKKWYVASKKDSLQGLVVEEETGKNIAVSYDVKDAELIADAPAMLEAIRTVYSRVMFTNINTPIKDMADTWEILRIALDGK